MKLKLTHDEFAALFSILGELITLTSVSKGDIYRRLVFAHMVKIYEKFYRKAIHKESKYSIKLTDEEALAFFATFNNNKLPFATQSGNLINTINNAIHKNMELP